MILRAALAAHRFARCAALYHGVARRYPNRQRGAGSVFSSTLSPDTAAAPAAAALVLPRRLGATPRSQQLDAWMMELMRRQDTGRDRGGLVRQSVEKKGPLDQHYAAVTCLYNTRAQIGRPRRKRTRPLASAQQRCGVCRRLPSASRASLYGVPRAAWPLFAAAGGMDANRHQHWQPPSELTVNSAQRLISPKPRTEPGSPARARSRARLFQARHHPPPDSGFVYLLTFCSPLAAQTCCARSSPVCPAPPIRPPSARHVHACIIPLPETSSTAHATTRLDIDRAPHQHTPPRRRW